MGARSGSFREFFESPDFRTDGLKLYPTLVIRGTGLYELWRTGRHKNYAPDRLVDLVARVLALVPPWVRVQGAATYRCRSSPRGWRRVTCGSSRSPGWVTSGCGAGTSVRGRLVSKTSTEGETPGG